MQIGGKNIADGDLEATVEASHPAICRGSTCAFAVPGGHAEVLVVMAEIERRSGDDRRSREVSPRDALESFWFEVRDRRDRRLGGAPAPRLEDADIVGAIRKAVRASHDLEVGETLLAAPGVLPRTPDGRVDREMCRARMASLFEEDA
jgi:hypothetical protein